jgi:hypothetical protein
MPTVIYLYGWRFFFFSNEGNEPIHIHVEKAEKKAKYWLDVEKTDIQEAFCENLGPRDKREVKKVIFEYFDLIIEEWNNWKEQQNA